MNSTHQAFDEGLVRLSFGPDVLHPTFHGVHDLFIGHGFQTSMSTSVEPNHEISTLLIAAVLRRGIRPTRGGEAPAVREESILEGGLFLFLFHFSSGGGG